MIDSHTHLDRCSDTTTALVQRAEESGVDRMLTVATDPESVDAVVRYCDRYANVFGAVGLHPHGAEAFDAGVLDNLRRAAGRPKVVAIGETGLDFFRDHAPRAAQERAFIAQMELAVELKLPLIVHTREADESTFSLLARHGSDLTVVIHCFSSPNRLDESIERGYYCSFSGNVTYPKSLELREAAAGVPIDRLLVETDAPYLAPQEVRGRPNEPANVTMTARFIARLRDIEYSVLESHVAENARTVFRW